MLSLSKLGQRLRHRALKQGRQSYKRRYATENGSNQAKETEKWAKIIEEVHRSSRGSKYSALAIFLATAGVFGYQMIDTFFSENTFFRVDDLNEVITLLGSKDPESVLDGMNSLQKLLTYDTYVFSGKTNVEAPLSNDNLLKIVRALLRVVAHGDSGNRWRALSWIEYFTKENPVARTAIATEAIELITDVALNIERLENINNEWVIASQVLIHLINDPKAKSLVNPEIFVSCIEQFKERIDQPVAVILSAQMSSAYNPEAVYETSIYGETGYKMIHQCVEDSVAPVGLHLSKSTGANLSSIFLASLLASGWSTLRWGLRYSSRGAVGFKTIQLLRSHQTGRLVFTALLADYFLQHILRYASTEKFELDIERIKNVQEGSVIERDVFTKPAEKINEALEHVPTSIALSRVAPICQNLLFGTTIFILHSRRRYILLPLAVAFVHNHLEDLEKTRAVEWFKDAYQLVSKREE